MKTCEWCQDSIVSYEDHQNIFGAYTCTNINIVDSKKGPQYKYTKLYHQTSKEKAESILRDKTMRPGSCGMAGPGIYFATIAENTHHKARHQGVILECLVDLGNVKQVPSWGDASITGAALLSQGYHSVHIPRERGEEYVVYDSKRIKHITIYKPGTRRN